MHPATTPSGDGLRKLWRFLTIYGPGRTAFKAAGRLRLRPPSFAWRRGPPDVGLIGCGQFAFATIGYFLQRSFGQRLAACFDIDAAAAGSLARALRVPHVCASAQELLSLPGLRTVYIASNHASHTPYAVAALEAGLDVVVEKPIAVTRDQLASLLRAKRQARGRLFAGYNRPMSPALAWLREWSPVVRTEGITLQCFVSGHQLGADHWYRQPEEGTRVCGNIGHWLDLMVHVLSWRGLPDRLEISLGWADPEEPDDNLTVVISSEQRDLFCVTLSSRSEPFEGIREVIHFHHGATLAEIEDFRRITIWQGAHRRTRRFWPKDVGHRNAVLQPFAQTSPRDWHEVELSTLLMLHIADLVRERRARSTFSLVTAWRELESSIARAGEREA
jgi:predicted dehydrogenase